MSGLARQVAHDRPVLVLLSGLPGTGKSSFARQLAAMISIAHVQTDDIRRELFPVRSYDPDEHQRVFEEAIERTTNHIRQRRSVVVDATMLSDASRRPFMEIADRNDAGLAIVQFEIPEHDILPRLERRLIDPDPDDMSEAGIAVYEMLKPGYRRVRQRHWRITNETRRDQVLNELAALLRLHHSVVNVRDS